jgi:hypothetical protein
LLGDVNTGMAVHALYLWDRVSVKGKEYFPAVVTEVIGDHEDVATLGPMCRVTYDEDLTVEDVPQHYLRLYEGPALNRDPGSAGEADTTATPAMKPTKTAAEATAENERATQR